MNVYVSVVQGGESLLGTEVARVIALRKQLSPKENLTPQEVAVFSQPPHSLLLAQDTRSGKIVGMVCFAPYYRECREWGYLWNMVVDEQYRGQGVGKKLVARAAKLADGFGKTHLLLKISVETLEQYYRALEFSDGDEPTKNLYRTLQVVDSDAKPLFLRLPPAVTIAGT